MTQPPDDLTQPIPSDATYEQPAVDVPVPDAAAAAVPVADAGAQAWMTSVDPGIPGWARPAQEGDGAASARPAPAAGVTPVPPIAPVASTVPVGPVAAASEKKPWRSRVSGGRALAVGALVVGLGLGAIGGSAATWAVTHDDGPGAVADGTGGFDRDGDGGFGPRGGHGGPPPGGRLPDGGQQQDGGTTGQPPGGGAGTDDSSGDTGTDANGTSQAT